MHIPRQHRLYAMSRNLGQITVIDAFGPQMRDVAVAALVRANIQAAGLPSRLPNVAIEVALAPHAAGRGCKEKIGVGVVELNLSLEEPGEGRGDGDGAASVDLAVVGLGALEYGSLVGGTADLEGLAVEVIGAEGQDLAEAQAGVGEDTDHRLVGAGGLGEGVHLLEGEDADRAGLLLGAGVVGSDPDSLEGIEIADFVGDRVLGHRRERAEDADSSGGGSALLAEHVIDQGEGVAAAKLAHRSVSQGDALDLYVGDAADPVLIGGVRPLGSWMALGPGGEVVAEGVGPVGKAVRLVDRLLASCFRSKVPRPPFHAGFAIRRLPSRPV